MAYSVLGIVFELAEYWLKVAGCGQEFGNQVLLLHPKDGPVNVVSYAGRYRSDGHVGYGQALILHRLQALAATNGKSSKWRRQPATFLTILVVVITTCANKWLH
jgi:hypothetical protein